MRSHQPAWSRRAALTGAAATAAGFAFTGNASARPKATLAEHPASGRLYELRRGRHRLVVAGVAATLLSWEFDGAEMLLTHRPSDVGEGYQGKTILPWPNRIDQGRYRMGGREYQVPINEPTRQASLHGLMSFVEWSVVETREDRILLEYVLPPQYGYPFSMMFRIEYVLERNGPRCTLWAKNVGEHEAPFGTANHTYLAAAKGSIDAITLHMPASTYYLTNDRLIPTGTEDVGGTEYDFRSPREIGDTVMDTAFTDVQRQADGTAIVGFARPGGADVELWVDATHRYLQVYTDDAPESDRPARQGITVEPMTCAPNAFVTGDGVHILQPGDTHRGSWGYRVVN